MTSWVTSAPRVVLGLAAGAIAGGGLVVLLDLLGMADIRQFSRHDALFIFTYATVVWAAGLILVAPVPWAILHYGEKRSWPVAAALGAILTFVVTLGLQSETWGLTHLSGLLSAQGDSASIGADQQSTSFGWSDAIRNALVCGSLGALVGLVVWRTAYRRVQVSD